MTLFWKYLESKQWTNYSCLLKVTIHSFIYFFHLYDMEQVPTA